MPENSKFQWKQLKEQQRWQHFLLRTAGLLTLLSRYEWVESDKKGRSGNWNDPPLMLISRVLLSSPPTRSLASCILRCLLRNSIGFLPGNRRLRKYLPIVSERFKAFLARSSSCRNKRRRRCFNNWGRLVDFPEYLKSVTVVFRLLQLFRIARDLRCPKRFWVLGFSSKSIKPLPQYTILACPIKAAITSSPGGGGYSLWWPVRGGSSPEGVPFSGFRFVKG